MPKKSIVIKKPTASTGRSIGQNVQLTRSIVQAATRNDRVVSGIAK